MTPGPMESSFYDWPPTSAQLAASRALERRREAAREGGIFDPARGYSLSDVWGTAQVGEDGPPARPGLVGTYRIDPDTDMSVRFEDVAGAGRVPVYRFRAGRPAPSP